MSSASATSRPGFVGAQTTRRRSSSDPVGIERPDMKLALMLISSWLVASVSISIVLGKAMKRLDSPTPRWLPGDPSFRVLAPAAADNRGAGRRDREVTGWRHLLGFPLEHLRLLPGRLPERPSTLGSSRTDDDAGYGHDFSSPGTLPSGLRRRPASPSMAHRCDHRRNSPRCRSSVVSPHPGVQV